MSITCTCPKGTVAAVRGSHSAFSFVPCTFKNTGACIDGDSSAMLPLQPDRHLLCGLRRHQSDSAAATRAMAAKCTVSYIGALYSGGGRSIPAFSDSAAHHRAAISAAPAVFLSGYPADIGAMGNPAGNDFFRTFGFLTEKINFLLHPACNCGILIRQSFPRLLRGVRAALVVDIEGCDGLMPTNMAPIVMNQK